MQEYMFIERMLNISYSSATTSFPVPSSYGTEAVAETCSYGTTAEDCFFRSATSPHGSTTPSSSATKASCSQVA